ncbi:MAG: ABC-F family ATP-binding cassette domain-containing protein [Myxococcales bacterium FL481]|nr:MAG: ABC-F family ATP-binding cassette domain-containing protein [Myxococcales bacterium FL481]
MSLLVLESAALGYGQKRLFADVDLRIADGDRIGLVGPNGSGKTSLMRVLAGQQALDDGAVRPKRALRVGYLPQDIVLDGGKSVLEFVIASVPGRETVDAEIEAAQAELEAVQARAEAGDADANEPLLELAQRVADLHERAAHFDTHYSEHQAARILAGLGFDANEFGRDLDELSGGWKMRALLAALLFQSPDVLLLDEPTNHLDMPSVAWLGNFLQRYSGAFVLICHDREFLNEQISRVVSFESEGVRQYAGDYEHYRRQRSEEEIVLENEAKNMAREREKAEQFITRFRAQANKAKAVQSRVKALDRMAEVKTFQRRNVMRFAFPPCARAGEYVLKIEGLGKRYGDHGVFSGVDLTVRRGEKIGIIGVNGAGKTTLLRIIAGELAASSGEVSFGTKVDPGYYAQHHTDSLSPDNTIFDEVAQRDPEAGQTRVRSLLGAFLFSGDDVDKKVSVLSGGERSRVALARLLVRPGNMLLMDEPTNHLDLESSESLAESLRSYDGTLIFVSHNRSFVRHLATRIWNVADGTVDTYPGTLDEYLERSRRARDGDPPEAPKTRKRPAAAPSAAPPQTARAKSAPATATVKPISRQDAKARKRDEAKRRAEYNRIVGPAAKKVEAIEAEVTALEAKQKTISAQLTDPACYEDEAKRRELLDAFSHGAASLDELSDRWEIAQAELEDAQARFGGD